MTAPHHTDPLEVALGRPEAAAGGSAPGGGDPHVTISAEQLQVATEWVAAGRVTIRRRIVTERRTVEVDVRREIVEFGGESVDLVDGRLVGLDLNGPPTVAPSNDPAPFVAILREEVPVVTLQVRPYERLTLTTTRVDGLTTVHAALRHDEVDVDVTPHTPHDTKEN